MSFNNNNPLAIKISNLEKEYYLGKNKFLGLMGKVSSKNNELKKIKAIDDISLEIKTGDKIGLLGHNGSGKSTLLRMISDITVPTKGEILINGKVCSILQGRVGFHPELTGKENIYLSGVLHGMRKEDIETNLDEIIEFSECSSFIDTPLKRYSDGMTIKLAFSILSHLDGNIYIFDEMLATVDQFFREKTIKKIKSKINRKNSSLIFVSHQLENIVELCNKVVILENGKLIFDGDLKEGVERYKSLNQ